MTAHPATTTNVNKNQSIQYVFDNRSSYDDITNASTISTQEQQRVSRCCCYSAEDPNQRYTPAFFQKNFPVQAQNMYKQWMALSDRYFGDTTSTTTPAVNNTPSTSNSCEAAWIKAVFHEIDGHYIPHYMKSLRPHQMECPWFRFVPEESQQRKPRILLLGDSLSMGIWVSTQDLFQNNSSVASIHGAPCNCMGIEKYQTGLQQWLGDCEWDLIQFNIGMHYHHGQLKPYQEGLVNITARLREHSPNAHVVFALTTPSPFDSNETVPNRTNCANYNKFHKAGVVASLNEAAISTLQEQLNVTINDRYHAILPKLGHYQRPCDVHLIKEGYEFLARHDWNLFTSLLSP